MSSAPNVHEVARRAGVSIATVSRVFNTPDVVLPQTRQLVQRVAHEVGYVPNAQARTLRTQRSRVLGVVLPTLLNPVFAECLQGIAQAATAAGYSILPLTSEYVRETEDHCVSVLAAANVDGLILVLADPATSTGLRRVVQRKLPYVLVYNRHPDHPCVSIDGESAVAELVGTLAMMGHRDIAMVSGVLANSDRAQQRYRGYLAGMRAARLRGTRLIEVPFVESGVDHLAKILAGPGRPTAMVCSNDLLAIRCVRAAHLSGLNVPGDLTVTGFDGIALGEDLTPMLSTVTQPNDALGSRSVQLIVQALAAGEALTPHSSVTLEYGFREGESCAAPPETASQPQRATRASRRRT
jgi:DNA-binding LacI/PurR family transcriptional regulator